jgi:hypothetical protein
MLNNIVRGGGGYERGKRKGGNVQEKRKIGERKRDIWK